MAKKTNRTASKKSQRPATEKAKGKQASKETEARKKGTGTSKKAKRTTMGAVTVSHTAKETISKKSLSVKAKASKEYLNAERAYRRYGNQILDRLGPFGVVGLSFGPRFKNGRPTNEMTIRLHVKSDAAKRYLKEHADEIGFKETYGDVGTDIVVWHFQTSSAGGASHGQNLLDGKCIIGGGGNGTLGTKVNIKIPGGRSARWITAGHVVSRTIVPTIDPTPISLCVGAGIGSVSKSEHFRNEFVDVAFIKPDPALPAKTTTRIFAALTDADIGADVSMKGAVTPNATGTILELPYNGTVTSPAGIEEVVDHFSVQGDNGQRFAVKGDSGSIVTKTNGVLVGIVRAATPDGIAVVTELDVVAGKTIRFTL
jgi:hypothetical protein